MYLLYILLKNYSNTKENNQLQQQQFSKLFLFLSNYFIEKEFIYIQEMLSWLLNGPLSLLFVLSGIVLNALCIIVFLRLKNTGNCSPPIIHYYLISLACWHSALLCNAFVLYCLPTLLWGSVISTGPYVHLYPPTYMLANATHTGTVWIILALTLDRYLALCMPFKHRIFSKRSRVKRLVVGLSILAILFSFPRFFEVATADYLNFYHILLGSTFVTILPGLLTFILTLRITIALREAQHSRKRLSSNCEQQLLRCTSINNSKNNSNNIINYEYKNISKNNENFENGNKEEEKSTTNILFNEKQQHKIMLLGGGGGGSQKNGNSFNKKNNSIKGKEHRSNVLIVVIIIKFLISDILPTVLDVFETFIGNEAFMSSPMATLCVDFSNMLLVLNCSTNFWVFILYVRGFRNLVDNNNINFNKQQQQLLPHSNRFNNNIIKQKHLNKKRRSCSLAIEQQQQKQQTNNITNILTKNISSLQQQQQQPYFEIYLSQQKPLDIILQKI
ncbi:G_PROTEIN_RECEP_F1_2 domain-containing protein [Meloidogyne graminicola]|uniref:G_PROTEIN_RECEP_F1_2 domain-containing protein n=1 Tax=Meloidogyne graminicola TaxID=189291 RepID=A0A8S9ZNF9_9BILA|nr:G_PROTEIN_RECEP_F1_2 domain-containing protein [Meloidogyne graminicola]